MLSWSLFTVGYIVGVLMTLKFFVAYDKVTGIEKSEIGSSNTTSWDIHRELIKPNRNIRQDSRQTYFPENRGNSAE